jgi:hypothetical protein
VWTFNYDLVGPQAPVNVSAGIGENVLVVSWSQADQVDTDLYQYQLLCDPPPNSAGGAILGAAGYGGGDDGEQAYDASDCYTSAFTPGATVSNSILTTYGCGTAQNTSTNAEAKPLDNFTRYTIAVVAEDKYHNLGVISNLSCNTPEPVTDFYEAYRAAGGKGGGGFCSIIGAQRSHALTLLLFSGSLAFFVRRRGRRQGQDKDRA